MAFTTAFQQKRSKAHGPLGPIARTAEYGNNDVSDNRTVYYLRDAMGGHTGLLLDHDADLSTPSQASFSVYDAFGNGLPASHLSEGGSQGGGGLLAGSFAWRGGEGSVRDAAPKCRGQNRDGRRLRMGLSGTAWRDRIER